MNSSLDFGVRQARRVIVFVIGITVLAIGVVMIVAPGPALIVIPAGLAILATEFLWARRWLRKIKQAARRVAKGLMPARGSRKKTVASDH